MSSFLYKMFGNNDQNMNYLVGEIERFGKGLSGNPNQLLNEYIRNANIPQGMLNQAQMIANQVYQIMKKR